MPEIADCFEERNYYDVLDDIVDDAVLLNYKKNEIRNTNAGVEASYKRREDTVVVPPPMYVQPDRLTLSPGDDVTPLVSNNPDRLIGLPTVNTDGVSKTKDNREQTLYNSDSDYVTITGTGDGAVTRAQCGSSVHYSGGGQYG